MKSKISSPRPFSIAGTTVEPGTSARLDLEVARLPAETRVSLPVKVLHGRRAGPRMWVSAAIHGDEINGVEIVHRLLQRLEATALSGTLIAVPIVNVFGFLHETRYLPDRRDLNRSFPGSKNGSLASRLANLFMREIVRNCDYGIDLHTGAHSRTNLPQVRANLDDPATRTSARAFGTTVILHAKLRDGSLREVASRQGIPVLVYEGGEAGRFDEHAIRAGVRGVVGVMRSLGMVKGSREAPRTSCTETRASTWIRCPRSGILRLGVRLGQQIRAGEEVGVVADPFGENATAVLSRHAGTVIGLATNPVVYQGDAVVHVTGKPSRRD